MEILCSTGRLSTTDADQRDRALTLSLHWNSTPVAVETKIQLVAARARHQHFARCDAVSGGQLDPGSRNQRGFCRTLHRVNRMMASFFPPSAATRTIKAISASSTM